MDDTEAAPEVQTRSLRAWGEADPTDVIEYRERSWRAPILLTAAALAAVALVGTMWPRHHTEESRPQATPQSAPKPQVAPQTRDDRYIALIQQRGMIVISRDMSIKAAHAICDQHKHGIPDPQMADELIRSTPGMTMKGAAINIDTAREVYCP